MTAKPDRKPSEHIVFLDLETTGLEELNDLTLEIAAIVVDSNLEPVKTWSSAIQVEEAALVAALAGKDYVRAMHTRNGLLAEIADGHGVDLAHAKRFAFEMLSPFLPVREDGSFDKITLAGNSVHFDLRFLRRQMPDLAELFSHRLLDVSAYREACVRWAPELRYDSGAEPAHRALDDARSSIEQLRHYLAVMGLRPRGES